jgi:hypothetical protein
VPTLVTLDIVGSVKVADALVYSTRSPTENAAGKVLLELLTVLTPPDALVIVATPTIIDGDWITSALNVLIPVLPSLVAYTDLTSANVCAVTAMAILPFGTPSKIKDSFCMKSPSTSYTVSAVPTVTASFKNPVAPLLDPLIKVGTVRVVD